MGLSRYEGFVSGAMLDNSTRFKKAHWLTVDRNKIPVNDEARAIVRTYVTHRD
jgi:hypothetical protein